MQLQFSPNQLHGGLSLLQPSLPKYFVCVEKAYSCVQFSRAREEPAMEKTLQFSRKSIFFTCSEQEEKGRADWSHVVDCGVL